MRSTISKKAAWRKTLEVFDEERAEFADAEPVSGGPGNSRRSRGQPAGEAERVGTAASRVRSATAGWHASCGGNWDWTSFWQERLPEGREAVSWEKVLRLLVVNRLIDPGSEFRVHRQWFLDSAMDELLGVDFAVAEKDRLYRCLDRVLEHKQELFVWLQQKWADLFQADFEVLLYDLTSTYFEGEMEQNPKARRGYSRDGRPDCLQVVIALVVTPDGFPLAYEVMNGNTSDRTTLRGFLDKIEQTYGKARRVWVMDRGIPTEAILAEMRDPGPADRSIWWARRRAGSTSTSRSGWICRGSKVRDSVEVKLFEHDGELMCWPKAKAARRRRSPCGASGWRACCASCARCDGVCRHAISC